MTAKRFSIGIYNRGYFILFWYAVCLLPFLLSLIGNLAFYKHAKQNMTSRNKHNKYIIQMIHLICLFITLQMIIGKRVKIVNKSFY